MIVWVLYFSSEPFWRAGECGCQVCGGDGFKADSNQAGLRSQVKTAKYNWKVVKTERNMFGPWPKYKAWLI